MGLGEANALAFPLGVFPISCWCLSWMDKVKARDEALSVGCAAEQKRTDGLRRMEETNG